MTDKNIPGTSIEAVSILSPGDLPEFDAQEGDQFSGQVLVTKSEVSVQQELPVAEKPKEPVLVTVKEPQVEPEKEKVKETSVPDFDLGNFKNLSRATRFRLDGVDRPLYGKALYSYAPVKSTKNETSRIPLAVPTLSITGIAKAKDEIQSISFEKDSKAREWGKVMDDASSLNPTADAFVEALNRPGSTWEQIPKYKEKMLVGATAKRPSIQDSELEHSQALMYALSALKLGSPSQVPLWASGWWVSFRPASEEAWIAFNERLTQDKIQFGRAVSGLAFSNINAIFTERVLEFALDHLYETNIQLEANTTRRELLKFLRTPDIPAFIVGFLSANYPSGYPIQRACTADIGKCVSVIQDTVNLGLLQVTDTSVLEEKHKAHMARNSRGSISEKEVTEYQNSILPLQEREVTVMEKDDTTVRVTLCVPNAEDYIASGRRWINSIVDMVKEVLSAEISDSQRDKVYNRYAKATMLREYSHWIKTLHINTNVVKNLESLENVLSEITPHGTLRKEVYTEVAKFIEESTISVIAVPNYKCPVCNQAQKKEDPESRFSECLPLDVVQAFFNLALLRVVEIAQR